MINMMGQNVFNRIYEVVEGQINESIDVSTFANGIYAIDIQIGNTNIRKKLIKD